jgi:hypothetical protein
MYFGGGGGGSSSVGAGYIDIKENQQFDFQIESGGNGSNSNNSTGSTGGLCKVQLNNSNIVSFFSYGASGGSSGNASSGGKGGEKGLMEVNSNGSEIVFNPKNYEGKNGNDGVLYDDSIPEVKSPGNGIPQGNIKVNLLENLDQDGEPESLYINLLGSGGGGAPILFDNVTVDDSTTFLINTGETLKYFGAGGAGGGWNETPLFGVNGQDSVVYVSFKKQDIIDNEPQPEPEQSQPILEPIVPTPPSIFGPSLPERQSNNKNLNLTTSNLNLTTSSDKKAYYFKTIPNISTSIYVQLPYGISKDTSMLITGSGASKKDKLYIMYDNDYNGGINTGNWKDNYFKTPPWLTVGEPESQNSLPTWIDNDNNTVYMNTNSIELTANIPSNFFVSYASYPVPNNLSTILKNNKN